MPDIIAIAGRRLSGKSTASQYLIDQGYTRISFAGYLKKTIAELYSIPEPDLSNQDIKEQILAEPLPWDSSTRKELGKIIQEEVPEIERSGFVSYRDAMQFIGTEVCRQIDPNFHVKKTIGSMEPGKKYVLDDLRYMNEKEALDSVGAWTTFLIRPIRNLSLHISENSLLRFHFPRTLVNDRDPEYLVDQLKGYLSGKLIFANSWRIAPTLSALLIAAMDYPGLKDFNSSLDFDKVPAYLRHWYNESNPYHIEDLKAYFYQVQGNERVFTPLTAARIQNYGEAAIELLKLGEAMRTEAYGQNIRITS